MGGGCLAYSRVVQGAVFGREPEGTLVGYRFYTLSTYLLFST